MGSVNHQETPLEPGLRVGMMVSVWWTSLHPWGPAQRRNFAFLLHVDPSAERGSKRIRYNVNWALSEGEDFGGSMSKEEREKIRLLDVWNVGEEYVRL